MEPLAKKKCVPCEKGGKPLPSDRVTEYMVSTPQWKLSEDGKTIARELTFRDFSEAMSFVNKVAAIAESEGHHPDIHLLYSHLKLELSTHSIGGLSENDFIMAAKIDAML